MGFSDQIYLAGDDALSNEFEVIIPPFPGALDVQNTILRVTDLTIPDTKINTYEVKYKTQKLDKPAASNATENTFQFNFRVDKYWKVYEGLEAWLDTILDQGTGIMTPDIGVGGTSAIRIPIDVISVDSGGNVTKKGWTFTGCYISDLTGAKFDNVGDGNPLVMTATIHFIKKVRRS